MEYSIINIFCYNLPYDLSKKIYNEFDNRLKDAKYIIDNYDYYKILRQHDKALEILLAMTIFYKRVITNLDSAVKFHQKVSSKSESDIISIGSYDLDSKEKNRIQAILISFQKLKDEYNVPMSIFEYYETKEFLNHLREFLISTSDIKS